MNNLSKWFWRIAIGSCVFMAGYATTWWLLQLIQLAQDKK